MEYEVTATRKRPQTFKELAGQEFVVATLRSSIEQKRIAHAYLFSGPRGVGKTSAARILAKSLNCEKGLLETPCCVCTSCQEISHGNSLDVLEIDGASNTSVNDVREIKDEVIFPPNSSRYKVYIIDEVHMLSNSAFNALLKTIEEPPPYIVFVFATTEIHKVPPTIRSRCQQFNFRLIGIDDLKRQLQNITAEMDVGADEDALFWIAKEATGSLRDAYTLLDQIVSFSNGTITLEKIREKLGVVGIDDMNEIARLMIDGTAQELLEHTDSVLQKGISVEQFVIDLTEFFRNILLLKHGIRKESVLGFPPDSVPRDYIETYTTYQLEKIIELFLKLYRNLRFSLNSRFELELLISRLASIENLITPGEIIEKVESIRHKIEGSESQDLQEHKSSDPQMSQNLNHEVDVLQRIVEQVRREKLTLATSLEKATKCSLDANELTFYYREQDRFVAELVLKEKETIAEKASNILSQPITVKIQYLQSKSDDSFNKKVEVVKNVFRGEIVKGD